MERDTRILYIVVCTTTDAEETETLGGPTYLGTRTLFRTAEAAAKYAAGVAPCRNPVVVAGRFLDLRDDAAERFDRFNK